MNVLMISGAYPPDICGVGDYTLHLVHALETCGIQVGVLKCKDWSWRASNQIISEVERSQCDILHIQYPSIGYGYSLLPQILSARFPIVVTLHEFIRSRVPRKLASSLLLLFGKSLVFTSDYELSYARRLAPWITRKSVVIPIGTNIAPLQEKRQRLPNEVVYFGLITPHKGLERILEFASTAHTLNSGLQVRIVGQIPASHRDFGKRMLEHTRNLPVIWDLDKSEADVSAILARTPLAYLPFPDGASERRGSLKAMFASGVVCITTEGEHLPDSLRRILTFAHDGRDAHAKAVQLLSDRSSLEHLSNEGLQYSQGFGWNSIARRHIELYEAHLKTKHHR